MSYSILLNLGRLALLAGLSGLLAPAAHAQVQASLVTADASVQPGKPITVALRMAHDAPWHSFWQNAGTGLPTKLAWQMPAGWQAGEFQWPTPHLVRDKAGAVTGHGYEGVVLLPMVVTAPADAPVGQSVTLAGTARWLMCDKVCIPGKAEVSVEVPVRAEAPQPNADVRAALAAQSVPAAPADGYQVAATRDGKQLILHVAAREDLKDVHFFPLAKQVAYGQPQTQTGSASKFTLAIPLEPEEPGEEALAKRGGVLAFTDAKGAYRGVSLDLPFVSAQEAQGIASGSGSGGGGGASLSLGMMAFALMGGLILNLMPCVFPVLGIKIMGFVGQAGSDARKVKLHGLAFTAGVLISFWALAGLLAVLREGGSRMGWGFQLQSAPFVFALCVLLLVFALNLSGVFEFGLRATGVGGDLQMKQGLSGSFFSGVLATVVATPCSAPFLAPALGAALAMPTAQSFVLFTLIAVGLALPYLLLSIFPKAIAVLPRPGAWMETFKQAMAFPLYATVAYLLWVLVGQTTDKAFLAALFALTGVAMATWLYGRYAVMGNSAARQRIGLIGGAVLMAAAVFYGWPRAEAPTEVKWEPWSVERISALQKEGRPIYVDFTARWCATCQVNKKVVFGSDEVKAYLRDNNVATVKADWTNSDPLITAELAKWQRSAIPFNLVYRPGEDKPLPLPELLTPGIVLDAFKTGKVADTNPS